MEQSIFSEPFRIEVPNYLMAQATRSGTEPENEVIAFLENWAASRGIKVDQARRFGYDVPVGDEDKAHGKRGYEYLLQVPEHIGGDADVKVETFPGGKFIALKIKDPFADPFDRIPKGWETLVKHIRENGIAVNWCAPKSCLEEVNEESGVCNMTVMIRLI